MFPVINSSALIGWNVLSSLNAVVSTTEKNRILNKVTCFITRLIVKSYRQNIQLFLLPSAPTMATGPDISVWGSAEKNWEVQ